MLHCNSIKKKGYSFEMIIVFAALALIFLIIFGLIISGKIKMFNKNINDCESKGGKCIKLEECSNKRPYFSGCEKDLVCCIET